MLARSVLISENNLMHCTCRLGTSNIQRSNVSHSQHTHYAALRGKGTSTGWSVDYPRGILASRNTPVMLPCVTSCWCSINIASVTNFYLRHRTHLCKLVRENWDWSQLDVVTIQPKINPISCSECALGMKVDQYGSARESMAGGCRLQP